MIQKYIKASPNEQAEVMKKLSDEQRKNRILQIRQQDKFSSKVLREKAKRKVQTELNNILDLLQTEFEENKAKQEVLLLEELDRRMSKIGYGHNFTDKENYGELKGLSEKVKLAIHNRYKKAIKKVLQERSEENKSKRVLSDARAKVKEMEQLRKVQILSLPSVPPDPILSLKPVKSVSSFGKDGTLESFSHTHYHLGSTGTGEEIDILVERAYDDVDARKAAMEMEKRVKSAHEKIEREEEERNEKAELRHKHAMKQELLKQEHEALVKELEDLDLKDRQRRKLLVANIPKKIFQPPYQRIEDGKLKQFNLEKAFEHAYSRTSDDHLQTYYKSININESKDLEIKKELARSPIFVRSPEESSAFTASMTSNTTTQEPSQLHQSKLQKLRTRIKKQQRQTAQQSHESQNLLQSLQSMNIESALMSTNSVESAPAVSMETSLQLSSSTVITSPENMVTSSDVSESVGHPTSTNVIYNRQRLKLQHQRFHLQKKQLRQQETTGDVINAAQLNVFVPQLRVTATPTSDLSTSSVTTTPDMGQLFSPSLSSIDAADAKHNLQQSLPRIGSDLTASLEQYPLSNSDEDFAEKPPHFAPLQTVHEEEFKTIEPPECDAATQTDRLENSPVKNDNFEQDDVLLEKIETTVTALESNVCKKTSVESNIERKTSVESNIERKTSVESNIDKVQKKKLELKLKYPNLFVSETRGSPVTLERIKAYRSKLQQQKADIVSRKKTETKKHTASEALQPSYKLNDGNVNWANEILNHLSDSTEVRDGVHGNHDNQSSAGKMSVVNEITLSDAMTTKSEKGVHVASLSNLSDSKQKRQSNLPQMSELMSGGCGDVSDLSYSTRYLGSEMAGPMSNGSEDVSDSPYSTQNLKRQSNLPQMTELMSVGCDDVSDLSYSKLKRQSNLLQMTEVMSDRYGDASDRLYSIQNVECESNLTEMTKVAKVDGCDETSDHILPCVRSVLQELKKLRNSMNSSSSSSTSVTQDNLDFLHPDEYSTKQPVISRTTVNQHGVSPALSFTATSMNRHIVSPTFTNNMTRAQKVSELPQVSPIREVEECTPVKLLSMASLEEQSLSAASSLPAHQLSNHYNLEGLSLIKCTREASDEVSVNSPQASISCQNSSVNSHFFPLQEVVNNSFLNPTQLLDGYDATPNSKVLPELLPRYVSKEDEEKSSGVLQESSHSLSDHRENVIPEPEELGLSLHEQSITDQSMSPCFHGDHSALHDRQHLNSLSDKEDVKIDLQEDPTKSDDSPLFCPKPESKVSLPKMFRSASVLNTTTPNECRYSSTESDSSKYFEASPCVEAAKSNVSFRDLSCLRQFALLNDSNLEPSPSPKVTAYENNVYLSEGSLRDIDRNKSRMNEKTVESVGSDAGMLLASHSPRVMLSHDLNTRIEKPIVIENTNRSDPNECSVNFNEPDEQPRVRNNQPRLENSQGSPIRHDFQQFYPIVAISSPVQTTTPSSYVDVCRGEFSEAVSISRRIEIGPTKDNFCRTKIDQVTEVGRFNQLLSSTTDSTVRRLSDPFVMSYFHDVTVPDFQFPKRSESDSDKLSVLSLTHDSYLPLVSFVEQSKNAQANYAVSDQLLNSQKTFEEKFVTVSESPNFQPWTTSADEMLHNFPLSDSSDVGHRQGATVLDHSSLNASSPVKPDKTSADTRLSRSSNMAAIADQETANFKSSSSTQHSSSNAKLQSLLTSDRTMTELLELQTSCSDSSFIEKNTLELVKELISTSSSDVTISSQSCNRQDISSQSCSTEEIPAFSDNRDSHYGLDEIIPEGTYQVFNENISAQDYQTEISVLSDLNFSDMSESSVNWSTLMPYKKSDKPTRNESSLQEAFARKKQQFIRESELRKKLIKENRSIRQQHVVKETKMSSISSGVAENIRDQVEWSREKRSVESSAESLRQSKEERRRKNAEAKSRTKRLYERLPEVQKQAAERERKEAMKLNKERAERFHQKLQRKRKKK